MDIFDLSVGESKKELDRIISSMSKEELLKELIECGLEINEDDK